MNKITVYAVFLIFLGLSANANADHVAGKEYVDLVSLTCNGNQLSLRLLSWVGPAFVPYVQKYFDSPGECFQAASRIYDELGDGALVPYEFMQYLTEESEPYCKREIPRSGDCREWGSRMVTRKVKKVSLSLLDYDLEYIEKSNEDR